MSGAARRPRRRAGGKRKGGAASAGKERARQRGAPLRGRLARAVAIIAVGVAACLGVEAAADALRPGVATEALQALSFPSDGAGGLPEVAAEADVPEGFAEEVLDLSQSEDVRVSADGCVVGFLERGSAQESFARLGAQLEEGGWQAVGSGRADCGSFVKGAGAYRWLFLSCVQSGERVSVVVQVQPE